MYNIIDYGASPDGRKLCTVAIQKAIDDCHERGGGRVYLPAGRYLTGTLFLKSRCVLYLENGATILGSPDHRDYKCAGEPNPFTISWANDGTMTSDSGRYWALIIAEDSEDVGIEGGGVIDG